MKRIYFFAAILGVMIVTSCTKASITITPGYDYDCNVPAVVHIPSVDTTIFVNATIDVTDSRLEDCESAGLESFYIEIKTPSKTFSWCKEARLFLIATGFPETEVVSMINVNSTATRIDFTVNSVDLVQCVKNKTVTVKARLVLRETFVDPMTIHGNIKFKAKVKSK